MISACAAAMPSYPGLLSYTQPDGSVITIMKKGDERFHLSFSSDGYPLCFNPSTKAFEYASVANGRLVASGIVASEPSKRTEEARKFLSRIDKAEAFRQLSSISSQSPEERRSPSSRKVRSSNVPTTGHHKVLVILAQFSDKKFSGEGENTKSYYEDFFNGKDFKSNGATGSAFSYFYDSSSKQYSPEFVVAGPVTVSGNASEYAGEHGTEYAYKLITEAVNLVNGEVDFSQFDSDGDGNVDNVYVVYAGYGAADRANDTGLIWPHSSYLSSSGGNHAFTVDGVKVDRYTCSQELNGRTGLPNGIGTFCHEFGHVLGLPDLYATDYSYSPTLEDWDIMDHGGYCNNGNTPPAFSSFERYSLGWLTPVTLTSDADSVISVRPLSTSNEAYRIAVPGSSEEYFLLENRQQNGWDSFLPGHGLLVWHIDENRSAWGVAPNNNQQHPCVDIVEADGKQTANSFSADPFPGTDGVTKFNFQSWNTQNVFSFATVKEGNGNINFILDRSNYKLALPSATATEIKGKSVGISWVSVPYAEDYTLSVSHDGAKLFDRILSDTTLAVEGLQPETDYTATVVAGLAHLSSDISRLAFTTTPLQFSEKQLQALPATNISSHSFTANWDKLDGATAYKINLYNKSNTGRSSIYCDFTGDNSGLPNGWYTKGGQFSNSTYGVGAPSLRFRQDGQSLVMTTDKGSLTELSFWSFSPSGGKGLSVDEFKDGAWKQTGETISLEPQKTVTQHIALNNSDSVRIVFNRSTASNIYIDDIELQYAYDEYEPVKAETVQGDVNEYLFDLLSPGQVYAYDIVGINGQDSSLLSNRIEVELPVADKINQVITGNDNLNFNDFTYNLSGQRVGDNYKGIVVRKGRKYIRK